MIVFSTNMCDLLPLYTLYDSLGIFDMLGEPANLDMPEPA